MNEHDIMRLDDHRNDLLAVLTLFELLDETGGPGTPREAMLINLGKCFVGSKLELIENLLHSCNEQGTHHE